MKKDKTSLKKILIIILLMIALSGFSALTFVRPKNLLKKVKHKLLDVSQTLFNKHKQNSLSTEESNEEQLPNQKEVKTIQEEEISVTNKTIVKKFGKQRASVALSAIFKNTSQTGIPQVKIKEIRIYDKDNNLIAIKENNNSFSLVSNGEYPFSLFLTLDKKTVSNINSFETKLGIPAFSPNENVVRLNHTPPQKTETEKINLSDSDLATYHFTYKTTLSNDTDVTIGNIYKIAFLKYKGKTLTRAAAACCPSVSFEETNKGNSDVIDLNAPQYTYELKPGEARDYEFKMSIDPVLIEDTINPESVKLVVYFIGVKQKEF